MRRWGRAEAGASAGPGVQQEPASTPQRQQQGGGLPERAVRKLEASGGRTISPETAAGGLQESRTEKRTAPSPRSVD